MPLNVLTGLLRGLGRAVPNSGRKQLTSKYGNKNYYKGKGAKSMGRHTRKGGYEIQSWKLPHYVVPDLTDFELKPYVSHDTPKLESVSEK